MEQEQEVEQEELESLLRDPWRISCSLKTLRGHTTLAALPAEGPRVYLKFHN